MTDEEFDSLDQDKLQYNYAWTYNEKPQTELEEKNVSEDLMKAIGKSCHFGKFCAAISESGDYIYWR